MLNKAVFFLCTVNGLPFTSRQTREAMGNIAIDIVGAEVPTETYFYVFDETGKPTFLPAPLQSFPNSYVRIRNSAKDLIRYLIASYPDSTFKSFAIGARSRVKKSHSPQDQQR